MATTSPTEDYLIALRKILVERFSEGESCVLCALISRWITTVFQVKGKQIRHES